MERILLATAVPAAIDYFVKYRMLLDQVSLYRKTNEERIKASFAIGLAEMETLRQYVRSQDIAIIKSIEGVSFAENTLGQPVAWIKSLKESMEILPSDQFFKLRRNRIVRRDMIRHTAYDDSSHRITVSLYPPFDGEHQLSRESTEVFISWWQTRRTNGS